MRTDVPPGPVTLEAVQRYDDGQSVTWKIPFTVVPGAESALVVGLEHGDGSRSAWRSPSASSAARSALLLRTRRRRRGNS